jgi:serine/threonine protein kinase
MADSGKDDFSPHTSSSGNEFGASYEVKETLARSPESTVYLARHILMERDVVIKVLNLSGELKDEKRRQRFELEAQLAAGLRHPSIVRVFSSGSLPDGSPYIVMEYVEGETLRKRLDTRPNLTPAELQEIFMQLLSGLECAHQAKLLHRDIKPENILLSTDTDGAIIAKLTDFGIAKSLSEDCKQSLTASTDVLGSPSYMSPEQCKKEPLDERSDLYSLACVLYEAIAGRPPFIADSALELMYKHVHDKPPRLSNLKPDTPRPLAEIIEKCLNKNPAERIASAQALKTALAGLKTGSKTPAGLHETALPILSLSTSRPKLTTAAVLLLLLLISGIFYAVQWNLQRQGKLQEAMSERTRKRDFFIAFSRGMNLRSKQQVQQAEPYLRQAAGLAVGPDGKLSAKADQITQAICCLAENLDMQHKVCPGSLLEPLEKASQQANSFDGSYLYALGYLSYSRRKEGRFQEALNLDLKALRHVQQYHDSDDRPDSPLDDLHVIRNAALSYVYCGRYPEALTVLKQANSMIKDSPSSPLTSSEKTKLLFVYGQLVRRSNEPESLRQFTNFLKEVAALHPEQETNIPGPWEQKMFDYAAMECRYARDLLSEIEGGTPVEAVLNKPGRNEQELLLNDFAK